MLYYLTRSLYPYDRTGGGLARYNQVQNFESNGIKVITVLPKKIQKNDARVLGYPFRGSTKLNMILQRVGIYEDYLDPWVDSAFASLSLIVKKTDVIVATSGGELGMLKLAMKLHAKIGCTYIANLHDPIDYSVINGNRIDGKFHVSRESSIKKILSSADSIVTSSEKYKKYLTLYG